ncbi:hypothetical protein CLV33_10747 [Jejuia pallidilutea]|uniref:CAAX prenyl protease 2/Lysostaphin resistance protein A-like domain-containing protein n=1 Tax=Jejuia pallidilutea TaxID=504487 RepID=A0A362X117_9FLAO|nr:type II CAAX endopeptidase family protein [Jejuia pallidilutea]PQV47265.1 hypothetical protein CLV33_10747 [Jejuia pallidilutea]
MKNKNAGWQRILLLIIPYFIIVGVFQLIGGLLSGIKFEDLGKENVYKDSVQHMVVVFASLLGTFLVIWMFMQAFDKKRFVELGFQIKNRTKDIVVGFLIGGMVMTTAYMLLLVLGEIKFSKIILDVKEVVISIITFVIVAVVEEALFRGYILRNLMLSFNKYIALFVSSILFSFMHGANPNINTIALVNLFLAGLTLGVSYIHTKNLWFPIALHLSWNLFQTLIGFNVSGQDVYSVVEFSMTEKNMINGGDFGFEGSVFAIVFAVVLIVTIELYYQKKLMLPFIKNK